MNKYQIKGTSGDVTGKKWPLTDSVSVGSESTCDVVLSGELIAPQHARFEASDTAVTLEAVQGDVFVNGEKVKVIALGSGDEIRFGNYRFMLQAPGLRPQRVLQPEAVAAKSRAGFWAALFVAAIAGAGFAAWQQGLLPF